MNGLAQPKLLRRRAVRRFLSDRRGLIAAGFLLVLLIVGLIAPWIVPTDPNTQNLPERFHGPGWSNWLGTDKFGRDIFSRLLVATRITVGSVAIGVFVSVILGVPVGLVSGLLGGWLDAVLGRINDGIMSIPPLVFALAIVGMLGAGLSNAMVAVGIALAPRFYRLSRSSAAAISHETYIEAARADGTQTVRLLRRHVLPNSVGPLLVQTTFVIGQVIVAEASLTFLGLGVQPPTSSWGSMLRQGYDSADQFLFGLLPPALLVTMTTLAFFELSDAIQSAIGRSSQAIQ